MSSYPPIRFFYDSDFETVTVFNAVFFVKTGNLTALNTLLFVRHGSHLRSPAAFLGGCERIFIK